MIHPDEIMKTCTPLKGSSNVVTAYFSILDMYNVSIHVRKINWDFQDILISFEHRVFVQW